MSANRSEILSTREKMEEEIKALKNDLQNVKSLLEKVIESKDEKKQHGRKYRKSIDEECPDLKTDPRRSEEQLKLFDISFFKSYPFFWTRLLVFSY